MHLDVVVPHPGHFLPTRGRNASVSNGFGRELADVGPDQSGCVLALPTGALAASKCF
jgi:hypothetical protein